LIFSLNSHKKHEQNPFSNVFAFFESKKFNRIYLV